MFFNVCLHLMMNVVVLVIYFFNVNLLLIICFAAGAFSLDQPGWLLRYVLCQQCWLGGLRFFPFPSYFFCFSFVLAWFIFLLQGQPGQEDGGGVNADPGFRSVCQKTLLVILVFIFNIILVYLFFDRFQSCCPKVPPQRRGPSHCGNVGRQNPRGPTRTRIHKMDMAACWDGGSSWDRYKVMSLLILGLSQHQSKKLQYYSPRPSCS